MSSYTEHAWPTYKKILHTLDKRKEVFYGKDICFREKDDKYEAVVHRVYFFRTFERC